MATIGNYVGSICTLTQLVGVHYAGTVCRTSQMVGTTYSGSVYLLSQVVDLRVTYSGSVCPLSQNIQASYAGSICKIGQYVRQVSPGDFYYRNGWDFSITIGNTLITPDMVQGNIDISFSESNNNLADFVIIIPEPVAFIDEVYDGASLVVINYYDDTGAYTVFTGLVETPRIDIINKTLTIQCNNQRTDLINSTFVSPISNIGRYSSPIQGTYTDAASELDLRLKTIPSALDFNMYNTLCITNWIAKSVADFTFVNEDVKRATPSIVWQDRSSIINEVVTNLKYQRTRLYHFQLPFDWTASYFGNLDDYQFYQYSTPTVTMVENAIKATTWKKVDNVVYTQIYPTSYNWFGFPYLVNVDYEFDGAGNVVKDPLGNSLYKVIPATVLDSVDVMKADWHAAIRFSQFIVEDYTLTVAAPQSITQNGAIISNVNNNYQDAYDDTVWSTFATPVNQTSYYIDIPELNEGTLNLAILTELDIARTSILATHRGTQVTVQLFFQPTLQLSHTVEINTDKIQCKGKVVAIKHLLDTNDGDRYTEVTIALFRSQGSTTETPRVAPARPTYTPTIPSNTVSLGNHYGIPLVTGTITDTWNGMIGSKLNYISGNAGDYTPDGHELDISFRYSFRPAFTDTFIVDTPAVPDSIRANADLPVAATYDIIIPNDDLFIDLTGV